jgi:hypothetical protein
MVPPLLGVYSLPWKHVYHPIAQQLPPLLIPIFLLSDVMSQYVAADTFKTLHDIMLCGACFGRVCN